MNIKGVIFDLDGTLLDSMSVWHNLGATYLKSQGLTPSDNLWNTIKDKTLEQVSDFFRSEYKMVHTVEQIMQQITDVLVDQYSNHIQPKPFVPEFLQSLTQAGVKLCVATVTERYLVEAALKRLQLDQYFSFITTCGEVGCGKDQGVIYQQALQRLGTPQEKTIVFEDALYAIKTAKRESFKVIAVYDPTAQDDLEEIIKTADRLIYSYDELEVSEL